MALKDWFSRKSKTPAAAKVPTGLVKTITAKTSDNVMLMMDLELYVVPLAIGKSVDEVMLMQQATGFGDVAAKGVLARISLDDFRKAPGDACEKLLGSLKNDMLELCVMDLRDVGMTNISAAGLTLPGLKGRASTAAADRAQTAQQAAQSQTMGLDQGIRVQKPLTLKKQRP